MIRQALIAATLLVFTVTAFFKGYYHRPRSNHPDQRNNTAWSFSPSSFSSFSQKSPSSYVHRLASSPSCRGHEFAIHGNLIQLLIENSVFRKQLASILLETADLFEKNHASIFFEVAPIRNGRTENLKFCVIRARALEGNFPDTETFSAQFQYVSNSKHQQTGDSGLVIHDGSSQTTTTFENLGGDAILIAPIPPRYLTSHRSMQNQNFACLASWLRATKNEPQLRDDLLKAVGIALKDTIDSNRKKNVDVVWFSTSGAGVSWLHFRLDQVPKYYVNQAYTRI